MDTQMMQPEAAAPVAPIKKKVAKLLGDKAPAYVATIANDLGLRSSEKLNAIIKKASTLTAAQVNKKLMALAEANKPVPLTDEQTKAVVKLSNWKADNLVEKLEVQKVEAISNSVYYAGEWEKHIQTICEVNSKIAAIRGQAQANPLPTQVTEVLMNPFFQLHAVNNETLEFSTSEVWLRWEKKEAAVKYEINLGRFLVKVFPNKGTAAIYPFENNITARGGYPHPHIQSMDGAMCWGNAATAISQMAHQGDIRPAMGAIEAFLHTYNDGSSYTDIYNFYEQRTKQELLKGKKGTHLFDLVDVKKIRCAYVRIEKLKKKFAKDLMFPLRESNENQRLFFPVFNIVNIGPYFVQLNDESWVELKEISDYADTVNYYNVERGDDISATVAKQMQRCEYYKEAAPVFEYALFEELNANEKDFVINRVNNHYNMPMQAIKEVVNARQQA